MVNELMTEERLAELEWLAETPVLARGVNDLVREMAAEIRRRGERIDGLEESLGTAKADNAFLESEVRELERENAGLLRDLENNEFS